MSINPLSDLFNYTKLVEIYEENKDKDWTEWLEYQGLFGKPGKQGVAGIMKVKGTDLSVAFKISQQIDNLAQHEYTVMNGLNELASFCPHFCKSIALLPCKRNPRTVSAASPFVKQADVQYMISDKMLLMEHVTNSYKLSTYIKSKKVDEDSIYSIVKQVLLGMSFAQKRKKLTHYDLHSGNIMVRKCNKDVVFVYVLDDGNQIAVPTLGHFPIIIDYGFSYISDMEDKPMLPTMGHTQYGYTSDRHDTNVDSRIFMVTVSDEIREARATKKARVLRKITKKAFASMKIDFESGWFESDDELDSAQSLITEVIEPLAGRSMIFTEYENFCIDIFQTLIILPVDDQETGKAKLSFKVFLAEWMKIEDMISTANSNLFILRGVVDAARYVRSAYMDAETSKSAVDEFKKMIHEVIDSVAAFCNPKGLNYEKMLCSMYVFADSIEGIYAEHLRDLVDDREEMYSKLILRSPEQFYAAIDTNIPTEYKYTENTTIFMMDSLGDKTEVFSLHPDDIEKVNQAHSYTRGSLIYDIYKNK
jgi:hypothetical protein